MSEQQTERKSNAGRPKMADRQKRRVISTTVSAETHKKMAKMRKKGALGRALDAVFAKL